MNTQTHISIGKAVAIFIGMAIVLKENRSIRSYVSDMSVRWAPHYGVPYAKRKNR